MQHNYRVHVTVRRQWKPISESVEYKTEHFEDLDEVLDVMDEFVLDSIYKLEEGEDDE